VCFQRENLLKIFVTEKDRFSRAAEKRAGTGCCAGRRLERSCSELNRNGMFGYGI
jgi:hypothetical protein